MRIGSKLQYTIPDICPRKCSYSETDRYCNEMCMRCPVFIFEDGFSNVISKKDFRDDWAEEWEIFFKTGREPILDVGD